MTMPTKCVNHTLRRKIDNSEFSHKKLHIAAETFSIHVLPAAAALSPPISHDKRNKLEYKN